MKIAIFTSAHLADDIRVYRKQLRSLLTQAHEIYYYTNSGDANMLHDGNPSRKIASEEGLHVFFNSDYNEDRRLARFTRSILFFTRLNRECSVYHFHDPDLLPTGLILKWLGKKVIYDVHENYAETILTKEYIRPGFRRLIARVFGGFEIFVARNLDAVVCATPTIADRFRNHGVKKVITVNNYPFKDELATGAEKVVEKKCDTVIFAGGITKKRGITELVRALPIVNAVTPCRLVLAGQVYPNEYLGELERMPGWAFVDYKGLLKREDMAREMARAKIGVITFLPEPNHIEAQPNKLFEYMSAKLPVVASDFPLWRELVVENQVGVCVDPVSADSVAQGIIQLLRQPDSALEEIGRRAHHLIHQKYNWEKEQEKLLNVYSRLADR